MDTVLEQIRFDFCHGKLSHAVLLDGGTESHRLDIAFQIAQMLVCAKSDPPCGVCSHCRKAKEGMHPDILHFAGGSTIGSFKVDTVRSVRQSAMVLPNEADRKIYILEHVESMSAGAQNALLKILEEPPSYVTFILTCASHTQLLDTVLSRARLYSLHESTQQTEDAQHRQASDIAAKILLAVGADNEMDVLRETAALEKDKELFRLCCVMILSFATQALKSKLTDADVAQDAAQIAMAIPREKLYAIIQIAKDTIQYINGNINGNLLLSYFCAQLFAAGNGRT